MADVAVDPDRRAELGDEVARLRRRIAEACAQVGRDPQQLTLIAVTKGFPAADVAALAQLGLRDVGENRDQEARAKAVELAGLDLRWHFVGQLQTNKVRSVVRYAFAVHSVDRAPLVEALSGAAVRADRTLDVFVQVRLDEDDPARGGARPTDVEGLADAVEAEPALRLAGVMAVAPRGADPDVGFARLAELSHRLREHHPRATAVSAGMSGDLEAAIRHGATHLRVGTALLGRRAAVVG